MGRSQLALLIGLQLLLGVAGCFPECPDLAPPAGERAAFQLAGTSRGSYSVSAVEDCAEAEYAYRAIVTSWGATPLYDDADRDRAFVWFESSVLNELHQRQIDYSTVWLGVYECNGVKSDIITIEVWSWPHADAVAKVIGDELYAGDLNGQIAVIVRNAVECAASG